MRNKLANTVALVYEELLNRGVVAEIVSTRPSLIKYEIDGRVHYLHSVVSDNESAVAYVVAQNKWLTSMVCDDLGVPHPTSLTVKDYSVEAVEFLREHKNIAVKPLSGAHGNGITLSIDSRDALKSAISVAKEYDSTILLQEMVGGDDIRLVFVGGIFAAAICRTPAQVVGDGRHTLRELIGIENMSPDRGGDVFADTHRKKIPISHATSYLGHRYETEVPGAGQEVRVVGPANLGTGGWARDVTDEAPSCLIRDAKKIVDTLQFSVCAVDFLYSSPDDYCLIEINSAPGLNIHDDGRFGPPRGVVALYVDNLLLRGTPIDNSFVK